MDFLRKLLFPFSLVYGAITAVRNFLFNRGWLKSKQYEIPVICVGNLSTGGTGKSPMIEYLVSHLATQTQVAVLSRGYKRKTTGYREAFTDSSVSEVGDEPLQIKKKFPNIVVAVCEDRQMGIEKLRDRVDLILLDDAFQHRKVKPALNILLTSFGNLYVHDCLLPAGNLREPKWGARRADLIVVTKCPDNLVSDQMQKIALQLKPKANQEIYFSKINYASEIKNEHSTHPLSYLKDRDFTLVTGIANPEPLAEYLSSQNLNFELKAFPDHHNFIPSEISELKKYPLILTTEKDFVRLQQLTYTRGIYYLQIKTEFLNGGDAKFKRSIEKLF